MKPKLVYQVVVWAKSGLQTEVAASKVLDSAEEAIHYIRRSDGWKMKPVFKKPAKVVEGADSW